MNYVNSLVRAQAVMFFRIYSWAWLNNSAASHTEILMTVVDRRALVDARVDALYILCCIFWISSRWWSIESNASRIACINSGNLWRWAQPWTGFETHSSAETESKQKKSIVTVDLHDFTKENFGDGLKMWRQLEVVWHNGEVAVIHENYTATA